MEHMDLYAAILGLILFLGVSLNRFSKFMKMPILICFLGVGVACGEHGLGLFPHDIDMNKVQFFGEIALCFIIFTGGLETAFSSIKKVFVTGTILSTFGVILTALLTGLCACLITQMSLFMHTLTFTEGILVGAVVSSTDAAAVFAILRGQKASINPRLQGLIEYESGSNDPAAFLLTSVMIGIVFSGSASDPIFLSWNIASGIIWGLGMGAAVGFLIGVFGQWFYNWIHNFLEYNGLRFAVAVAIVLFCFGFTKAVVHANALMACYVAGITMGNLRFNYKQIFIKFHQGISWLMQIMLFTILGSFFDYHMLFSVRNMTGAIFISITLMFIVRPIVVMLLMIKSPFTIKERIFTSWVGIRGSAPIMLAAMVMTFATLPEWHDSTRKFFYCVFTVVLFSILFQGSTIMYVARKLNLVLPYKDEVESPLEYDEKSDNREMYQFTVTKKSPLANQKLKDTGLLEADPVLLMIKRGDDFIQPVSGTELRAGDGLSFLGDRLSMTMLHEQFFADESYAPSMTFRQLWSNMAKKYIKHRHRAVRKKRSKVA